MTPRPGIHVGERAQGRGDIPAVFCSTLGSPGPLSFQGPRSVFCKTNGWTRPLQRASVAVLISASMYLTLPFAAFQTNVLAHITGSEERPQSSWFSHSHVFIFPLDWKLGEAQYCVWFFSACPAQNRHSIHGRKEGREEGHRGGREGRSLESSHTCDIPGHRQWVSEPQPLSTEWAVGSRLWPFTESANHQTFTTLHYFYRSLLQIANIIRALIKDANAQEKRQIL